MSIETWKDIKGFDGKYQVSNLGNVRRVCKHKMRILKPYIKKTSSNGRYVVHLTNNGKTVEAIVAQLVADAFLGKRPKGYIAVHKNGIQSDNFVNNIEYISKKDSGNKFGRNSRRRTVCKIDNTGNIVEFYPSARECAKHNFMSYQTIIDRCNLKCKSVFAPDGYAYSWDDNDKSFNAVIRKIELHNGYMVKANNIEMEW